MRNQQIINVNYTLGVLDSSTIKFGSRSVVSSRGVTSHGELGTFTAGNCADGVKRHHNVAFFKSTEDFSRPYFEPECILLTIAVRLSQM